MLLLLLLFSLATTLYYRSTQKLAFDISPVNTESVPPPQFLYSFNGGTDDRMQRPVGVLVDGDRRLRRRLGAPHDRRLQPERRATSAASAPRETVTPLYIAKNPKNGNLYVTDRRTRSIHIFTPAGKYVGDFDPKLPKDQLPKFETEGVQWAPVAIAFGADGTLYVTEILNGHRLLIFGPDGKFKKSVGTVGIVSRRRAGPEASSSSRTGSRSTRGSSTSPTATTGAIQVFDKDGKFKRIIVTQGLPRGISFLNPFRGRQRTTAARFVVVDTLAHDGTIWTDKGNKIVNFGEQGVLDGPVQLPQRRLGRAAQQDLHHRHRERARAGVGLARAGISPCPIPRLPQNWVLLPDCRCCCCRSCSSCARSASSRRRTSFSSMVDAGEADLMPPVAASGS